jgi:anti-anti-sigma factor
MAGLLVNVTSRHRPDGVVLVDVDGEIDMATVGSLTETLGAALAVENTRTVIVDFAEVTFCDSGGIAALDTAYANATERGIRLRVTNLQPTVHTVMEITGMLKLLTGP